MFILSHIVIFTKLFRGINVKTAHQTSNAIPNILTYKNTGAIYKCDRSGIYQLICPDCRDKYIGQTGNHSERGILNAFSLLNIEILIRYLKNTYMILDIHLALVSWILYILSR
jgi:hypothetical protein